MPGKKSATKDQKKKKPKRPIGLLEDPSVLIKRLLKVYTELCFEHKTVPCLSIRKTMKEYIDEDKLLVQFILQPLTEEELAKAQSDKENPLGNVKLEPLVSALRKERYRYVKDLRVWNIQLLHEHVASLAMLLEKEDKVLGTLYPVQNLELIDCSIEAYALQRLLSRSYIFKCLTSLCLDYNEFGDDGVRGLSKGLKANSTLLSISLCFCTLSPASGKILGEVVAATAIREMYVNGNDLEAEGTIELVRLLADRAENENIEKLEAIQKAEDEAAAALAEKERSRVRTAMAPASENVTDNPSSPKPSSGSNKKKKGKKKEPPPPPRVGPWIHKLHIADNGIDAHGKGSTFAPVITMRLFRNLIENSSCLEELDLDDNLIGDLGGREIMEALKKRKDNGLNSMRVSVDYRMNDETFDTIMKLGAGLKKKKKGKGKKKKK